MKTLTATLVLALAALCTACAASSPPEATGAHSLSSDTLLGEWTVQSVRGAPVPAESAAFLGFGDAGRVHGNTGVNQLTGSWSLDAGALEFGPLASTRMAGPPALMDLESRLFTALQQVRRAELGDDGRLALQASDSTTLVVASRRPR